MRRHPSLGDRPPTPRRAGVGRSRAPERRDGAVTQQSAAVFDAGTGPVRVCSRWLRHSKAALGRGCAIRAPPKFEPKRTKYGYLGFVVCAGYGVLVDLYVAQWAQTEATQSIFNPRLRSPPWFRIPIATLLQPRSSLLAPNTPYLAPSASRFLAAAAPFLLPPSILHRTPQYSLYRPSRHHGTTTSPRRRSTRHRQLPRASAETTTRATAGRRTA